MKKSTILIASAVAIATLGACSDDINFSREGEGRLILSAKINTEIRTSRAATVEELSSTCKIWISKADKGLMYKYEGIQNLPAEGLWLTSGNYVAEVWAGDSVPASFDARYFKGAQPFTISAGGAVSVEVNCKVANVVAAPKYGPEIDEMFTDYHMVIGHSRGTLDYTGEYATERGYFMMPSTDTDLTYTFEGTLTTGDTYTRTGTIANVQPATLYTLKVSHNYDESDLGGGYLDIVVDATEVEVNDEILISVAPTITGYGFDLAQGLFMQPGNAEQKSVFIKATGAMNSVIVSSKALESIFGPDGTDFNVMTVSESAKTQLNDGGILWVYNYDAANDMSDLKITFKAAFFENLPEGNYRVSFDVVDANNRRSTEGFDLSITAAKVEAIAPVAEETGRFEAVLRANLMKADATNYGFEYRKAATSRADGWTFVKAESLEGSVYTVRLTSLEAGATYEYRAVCDDYVGSQIQTLTTKSRAQLPNAGFEGWQLETPYLIYAAGDTQFWDSGNHGSATMKKNVTVPSGDIKHSGAYSIKLESQFVGIGTIGKFAAGNVFTGKYLATDGTDGILGFGRPFDDTPKALKGWVRYEPGTIQYNNSGDSKYDSYKGQLDTGIVYLALLDETTDKEYPEFPVVIKTKTGQLFDKNASNVIAYGETRFTEATPGSGMVEFRVELNYIREGVTPSFIICTGAASALGDFFTGGKSTMYLDDLEFEY